MTIWDRGRYEVVKWAPGEVKVVLRGRRLSGGYVLFRTGGDSWMIHRERVALPVWVPPMLATAGELPRSDGGWAYEMKWDGVRASAYLAGGRLLRPPARTRPVTTPPCPELAGPGARAGRPQRVLGR